MALYINDECIDSALVDQEVQRLRPSYEQVFRDQPEDRRERQLAEWARENVIEAVIFRQQARCDFPTVGDAQIDQVLEQLLRQEPETGTLHQRMDAGPDEQAKLRDEIADQIRHEQLTQNITASISEPTKKDVRKFYEENIERFTVPEMVHAAHIVKHPEPEVSPEAMRQAMEEILNKLKSGTPFEELAGEHSDCPDSAGDLGFFPRGKMVPAFEQVVFNLPVGEYSGIFETEFGLHIAKVYEKRPAAPCPLEQVREVVVRELKQQAQQKAIEQFLDAQKAKAAIEER